MASVEITHLVKGFPARDARWRRFVQTETGPKIRDGERRCCRDEVGFLRPQHRELLIVDATLDGLVDKMAAHRPLEATITRMSKADL